MVEWILWGSIIFLGGIVYTVWTEQSTLDTNMANLIGELRRRIQDLENHVDLLEQKLDDFKEVVADELGGDDEQST